MSAPQVPQIKNAKLFQQQLNAALATLYAMTPGYGGALPTASGEPDGRLFVLTTTNKLYQNRAGSWVQLT